MTLSIVILTHEEKFLQFLDPELCTITETIEKGGLRTLDFEYEFQDLKTDKELFKIGNKIWISGDINLTDCLYVINTQVENNVYEENYFKFEVEEALVELNYAPPFSQNELDNEAFTTVTIKGKQEVKVDWNALNYWFGTYFNIGIVQKCINNSSELIVVTGIQSLMSLLRYIEEETGNVFITRYEKDLNSNIIHRYLDFLNPINVNKDWELNIEYDFLDTTDYSGATDENDDPVDDTDIDREDGDTDYLEEETPTPITNIIPSNIKFRITKNNEVVEIGTTPLVWTNTEAGFTEDTGSFVIQLTKDKNLIGLETKTKSFAVQQEDVTDTLNNNGYIDDTEYSPCNRSGTLPDDCYFEMYDHVNDKVLYHTLLNHQIGTVHEEVLDFGYNLENVVYDTDETDTVQAVSPVITLDDDSENLNRSQLGDLIDDWYNLEVSKGEVIPMIVQKVNVNGASQSAAESSLGTCSLNGNYWVRPVNPNDNDGQSYEFLRATAYWRAPYSKDAESMYVQTDKEVKTQYTEIAGRQDNRDYRDSDNTPKMGFTETTEENKYSIFNQVCNYLQEHEEPNINIEVDIANLRNGRYNEYQLHDKVYVKIEDQTELITARVVKTTKEAHDIAKTEIEVDNYSINTTKKIQSETYLEAGNAQFTYPKTGSLTARLVNLDFVSDPQSADYDKYAEQYPILKLITFSINPLDNSNDASEPQVITKLTGSDGKATIPLVLKPGNYTVDIYFPGDEEYTETSMKCYVNVDGVIEQPKTTAKKVKKKQKTTKKTSKKKTKTVKTYWSKYGVSPDKKTILAIGRPSHAKDKGSYTFYEQEFKNKCPHCGKATLKWGIFWAGNEHSNWGIFPATGNREGGSAEGHIFCTNCDADYSCQGMDHVTSGGKNLKAVTKLKKSTKNKAYTLKKGKLQYGTKKVTVKKKKTTSSKTRQQTVSNINSKVKKQALNIVKDKKGWQAAHEIVNWVTKHIKYEYDLGFYQSTKKTLSRKRGNCCCQTALMLEMMDAAGCTEFLQLRYVYVCCGPRSVGHVFAQIKHRSKGTKRYVDPCNVRKGGWNGPIKGYGSPPGRQTVYPTKPF